MGMTGHGRTHSRRVRPGRRPGGGGHTKCGGNQVDQPEPMIRRSGVDRDTNTPFLGACDPTTRCLCGCSLAESIAATGSPPSPADRFGTAVPARELPTPARPAPTSMEPQPSTSKANVMEVWLLAAAAEALASPHAPALMAEGAAAGSLALPRPCRTCSPPACSPPPTHCH